MTLLPVRRSAIVGTVLVFVRVSVVPSLVAVIFWLMADWPPIFRSILCAVACEVAAAPKAGATASVETAAAPMSAPRRMARRFKGLSSQRDVAQCDAIDTDNDQPDRAGPFYTRGYTNSTPERGSSYGASVRNSSLSWVDPVTVVLMSGESQERDDAQLAFRAVFLAGVFLAGDFFAAAFLAGAFFAGLAGFSSSAAAAVSSLDSPRAVLAASTLRCRAAS